MLGYRLRGWGEPHGPLGAWDEFGLLPKILLLELVLQAGHTIDYRRVFGIGTPRIGKERTFKYPTTLDAVVEKQRRHAWAKSDFYRDMES